jgi:hypothetical protein
MDIVDFKGSRKYGADFPGLTFLPGLLVAMANTSGMGGTSGVRIAQGDVFRSARGVSTLDLCW